MTGAVCPHCNHKVEQPQMVSLGQMRAKSARKKKSPTGKKEKALRITLIVAAAFLALVVAAVTLLWAFLEMNLQGSDLSGSVGVNHDLPTKDVQNIALFGLDDRDSSTDGHSDAIMIVSIDRKHNKIKMTSIGRDTLVPIEGYKSADGKSKITHAFSAGGVNLAVKTINQNFGMNITDYVYVNFLEFAEIIDYMGGVTIDVPQKVLSELNNHVYWMEIECDMEIDKVKKAGVQRLSGGQALAYARVRKVDSDIQRGNRQREVLQALFNEMKDQPLTKFPGLISKLLKICHTNMTSGELMSIATWALTGSPEFANYSLPNDDCKAWGGNHSVHNWVWIYDLDNATDLLHNFIYEDGLSGITPTTVYVPTKPKTTLPATTTQRDAPTTGGTTAGTTATATETTTGAGTSTTGTATGTGTGLSPSGTTTGTISTWDVGNTTGTTTVTTAEASGSTTATTEATTVTTATTTVAVDE